MKGKILSDVNFFLLLRALEGSACRDYLAEYSRPGVVDGARCPNRTWS